MRPVQFSLLALLCLVAALAYLSAFPFLRVLLGMFGAVLACVAALVAVQAPIFWYLSASGRLPQARVEPGGESEEINEETVQG
jgi:hypothetical protein